MNKITYFILLLSFIGYISTSKFCMEMTTKEECISHKLSSLEEILEVIIVIMLKVLLAIMKMKTVVMLMMIQILKNQKKKLTN